MVLLLSRHSEVLRWQKVPRNSASLWAMVTRSRWTLHPPTLYAPTHLSIHLSIYLSAYASFHLFIYLSIYLSMYLLETSGRNRAVALPRMLSA
jgi:hypothetical protein